MGKMVKGRSFIIVPILIVLATTIILGVVAITNLGNHAYAPENEKSIPIVLFDPLRRRQ